MKDRYKFKAKRIDTGEWVVGCLVCDNVIAYDNETGFCDFADEHWCSLPGTPKVEHIAGSAGLLPDCHSCNYRHYTMVEIDPETIGPCTGVKDKNEKLVFIGDIVRIHEEGCEETTMTSEIKSGGFVDVSKLMWEFDCYPLQYLMEECSFIECEIIGNIHDKEGT